MRKKPRTTADRIKFLKNTIEDYKKAKGDYLNFIPGLQTQLNKLIKEQ